MDIMERLKLFSGMLGSAAALHYWLVDGGGVLLDTDCPNPEQQTELLHHFGVYDLLRQEMAAGTRAPVYLDNGMGVIFLAGFSYDGPLLRLACLYGPAFTGSDSAMQIRQKLNGLSIPPEYMEPIDAMLEQAAIIPPAVLRHDAVMLQYALTGEHISALDIASVSPADAGRAQSSSEKFFSEHRGVWSREQELVRMVRTGNTDYRSALEHAMSLSGGLRMKEGGSLRQLKNSLLVLLTLVSRAAIEGGLSSAIAYSLNDYYADRIEQCSTKAAIRQLSLTILDDYIGRVHKIRCHAGISTVILDTCDYIALNLTEALDVRTLAKRAGYAEYYFSAKFKKEVGQGITDYVNEKRMQYAGELLLDSDYSISDIQNLLGFSSRSRFYTLFKAYSGLTPAQYRANRQNRKEAEPE